MHFHLQCFIVTFRLGILFLLLPNALAIAIIFCYSKCKLTKGTAGASVFTLICFPIAAPILTCFIKFSEDDSDKDGGLSLILLPQHIGVKPTFLNFFKHVYFV